MRLELKTLVDSWSFDIPFERAVREHYLALEQLVTSGVTWPTIAGALTQAGARHKNGRPISAHQMNSVFLRIQKAQRTNAANAPSFGLAPRARVIEDRSENLSHPARTKSDNESVAIATAAVAIPTTSLMTGLAQRLGEAQRFREAARTEYDD
jgi:hypothetical protein